MTAESPEGGCGTKNMTEMHVHSICMCGITTLLCKKQIHREQGCSGPVARTINNTTRF